MKIDRNLPTPIGTNRGSKVVNTKPQTVFSDFSPPKIAIESSKIAKEINTNVKISEQEQAFFENLFPKAKKEIRAYIEQQEKISYAKGQLIDVKA